MTRFSKTKVAVPLLTAASIFSIVFILSPNDVNAEYDRFTIPEISGTVIISDESQNYSDDAQIALSVAMAVAENNVENGNAMWGKLDVVQGFLVYKVGVLTDDDVFFLVVVDAGNGEKLHVSEGVSKNSWKNHKHSDGESSSKWKDHYSNLTPEEREIKMQQWSELKEAFFALSVEERAKMIMHFMTMKVQLESMSDEEKQDKMQEMKSMMEELLPLSVEEKTQKLREYINSL